MVSTTDVPNADNGPQIVLGLVGAPGVAFSLHDVSSFIAGDPRRRRACRRLGLTLIRGRACIFIDAARRRVRVHRWLYENQQRVTSGELSIGPIGEVKNPVKEVTKT